MLSLAGGESVNVLPFELTLSSRIGSAKLQLELRSSLDSELIASRPASDEEVALLLTPGDLHTLPAPLLGWISESMGS